MLRILLVCRLVSRLLAACADVAAGCMEHRGNHQHCQNVWLVDLDPGSELDEFGFGEFGYARTDLDQQVGEVDGRTDSEPN